jgi:erythromycin esterase-like protein
VLNEPKPTRTETVREIVEWLRARASQGSAGAGGKLRASEA